MPNRCGAGFWNFTIRTTAGAPPGYICTSQNSNARSPDGAVAVIGAMAPGKAKAWLERRFALA
jgi:hypothetical protein